MTSTSKSPSLNEQCLAIVAAMNAMTPGINQVLFIREIMPTDVLIDDAFHFKTDRDLALYKTLKNDMDYYGMKRDEFVKSQNFSIASEYLTKYKRAKTIFHRQLQTLS
ncbi:MAG: hypothetical protein NTZ00_00685, partial [Bacteroidetes bacterium]|nr:hypothetical protein [Bacteroidota bacterium]